MNQSMFIMILRNLETLIRDFDMYKSIDSASDSFQEERRLLFAMFSYKVIKSTFYSFFLNMFP